MGLGVQSFNSPPPPQKKKNMCKQYMLEGVRIKWHVYLRFQFLHLIVMQNTFCPTSCFFPFSFSRPHLQLTQDVINTSCLVHAKLQVLVEHPMVKVETQNGSIYIYTYIYPYKHGLMAIPFLTLPYLHQRFTRNQLSFRPMAAYISH